MINLGDRVKDRITGFMGIITAECKYLNGCVSFQIRPEGLHEEELIKSEWIDEKQLVLMEMERSISGEFQEPAKPID